MKKIAPALRRSLLLQVLVLVTLTPGLVVLPVSVLANPSGQQVVAGNVNFQGLGTARLDINNLSQRAIINWQSFSIKQNEITNINQGANAFTLNRVVSGNPTAIYGQLKAAQGGVAVINPNGIVVGPGGSVDVAGMLTLSTLDISNKDFLNGGKDRFRGTTAAGVRNYGTVTSSDGDVVMMGNFLQNAGSVSAPKGVVAFGAGGDIIVDHAGGARISVQAGGAGGGTGIENTGEIHAAAAELKAHGNVYALAIKNDGLVRASGYNFKGGRLTLSGGSGGSVINTGQLQARNSDGSGGRVEISGGRVEIGSGTVDASGDVGQRGGTVAVSGSEVSLGAAATVNVGGSAGGTVSIASTGATLVDGTIQAVGAQAAGGNVTVEGDDILIGSTAAIDASGATGGGNVQIGGGFQGRDASIRNAESLRVDDGSSIAVNALSSGFGGNVILWSDGHTHFAGTVSAHGVDKGGFAEISGKSTLDVSGDIDVTADSGIGGTILLDPTNITISSAGAAALGGSTISNVWLSNLLDAGNNVVISTNIGGTEPGHITVGRTGTTLEAVGDRVEWYQDVAGMPGGTLTLLAMGNITFNTSVRTAGEGGINIVAGWNGTTGWSGPAAGAVGGPITFDMAAVLATMNDGNAGNDAAGLGGGSVFLGGIGTRIGVDVGSRWGDTNLAARDLIMRGSTLIGHGWAQLGFNDNGVEYELSRTHNGVRLNEWWGNSTANVLGKDYIRLLGGTEFGTGDIDGLGDEAFRGAGWGTTGDITVGLSGRVDARGGTTASYTQIGHGGILQDGSEWKRDQAVNGVANTLFVTTRDGIEIDPASNRRSFFSSTWRTNYAGDAARMNGDISVVADGDILMMAARDFDAADNLSTVITTAIYTMIGHGGQENHGSYHGDVTVTAHGTTPAGLVRGPQGIGIQVLGGRGTRSFGRIGHGSGYEGNARTVWDQTMSGDINVTATTGGIRLQAHNQAIRESGSDLNFGPLVDPNTPVPTGNTSDNSNLGSYVQIGHGGQYSDFAAAAGRFRMPGGTDVSNIIPEASRTGDINVFAGGTYLDANNANTPIGILVRAGNRRWQHAMIGHGGTSQRGDIATDQTPDFGLLADTPFGTPTVDASTGFNGNIRVEADKGSIIATGGDDFRADRVWGYGFNFVRIGHGGDVVRGPKGGTIDVLAGQGAGALAGDIRFTAAKQFRGHAQVGHGGYDSASSILGAENSAEINVTARGSISFVSPESGTKDALGLSSDYAYWWFSNGSPTGTPQTGQPGYWQTEDRWVMLGHGGRSGASVMPNRQDITVTAGTGDVGNADGNVNTGGITFISGDMERDFAQLGHGGYATGANNADGFTGNITVNALGGALRFDGSILGAQAIRRDANRSRDGVTVGPLTQGYGGGWEAYVQLGHGGYANRGVHSGDITVNAWGGVDFLQALAAPKINRSVTDAPIADGLTAGTNVWIPLANLRDTAVPAASELSFRTPEILSNIVPGTVRIELSDGTFIVDVVENGADDRSSEGDANAGLFRDGVKIGDIHYDWGLVRFQVGGAPGPVPGSGADLVEATFQTAQGMKERAYAQLGHGGYEADGPNNKANNLLSNSGDINIRAGGDIRFRGGAHHRAYAQLGHGGYDTRGYSSGDITIDHIDVGNPLGQVGGLRFVAGHGGHRQFDYQNYVQLGHGGYAALGNHFGNITVRGTRDLQGVGLLLKAGDRQDAYAQIGLGGRSARSGTGDGVNSFGLNGDIDIQVGGHVAVVAGTFTKANDAWVEDGRNYAMIGHGGWDADPSNNNTTNHGFTRTNPGLPVGTFGAGDGNWGHFGDISLVTSAGNVSFMGGSTTPVANRVDYNGNSLGIPDPQGLLTSFGGGGGRFHYAQLGHGGYAAGGDHYGNITVAAENGSVHVVGGMVSNDNNADKWNFAQVGHGSGNAPGNIGGADQFLKVHALGAAGNVVVMGGEAIRSSGHIGHGGYNSSGSNLADISVIAGNNLRLNSGAGNFVDNWGKIGHGDVRNGGTGVRDGDITVSVGNTLTMGRALIGHIDFKLSPGYFVGITEGDTYIAVGRRNPTGGGTGQFVTTAASVITSAGGGTSGELRLYMPSSATNQIAEGTFLNNTAYTRTPPPGSNRADEQRATEHTYPPGAITESDATFTPEGPYPFHGFGLYNIYYGGDAPPLPPGPPAPEPPAPAPPPPPFSFGGYLFMDSYDSFFRSSELFLYDGYDEMLEGVAYSDALEDDEDRERRRRASRQVGRGALTYYIYYPGTNRYSSYRVFGVEQSRLSIAQ